MRCGRHVDGTARKRAAIRACFKSGTEPKPSCRGRSVGSVLKHERKEARGSIASGAVREADAMETGDWRGTSGAERPILLPDAPWWRSLDRKAQGRDAELCYMGHALMENRKGLAVGAQVTLASGPREASGSDARRYVSEKVARVFRFRHAPLLIEFERLLIDQKISI